MISTPPLRGGDSGDGVEEFFSSNTPSSTFPIKGEETIWSPCGNTTGISKSLNLLILRRNVP
jgi:hypothetical protein